MFTNRRQAVRAAKTDPAAQSIGWFLLISYVRGGWDYALLRRTVKVPGVSDTIIRYAYARQSGRWYQH